MRFFIWPVGALTVPSPVWALGIVPFDHFWFFPWLWVSSYVYADQYWSGDLALCSFQDLSLCSSSSVVSSSEYSTCLAFSDSKLCLFNSERRLDSEWYPLCCCLETFSRQLAGAIICFSFLETTALLYLTSIHHLKAFLENNF